jgi:hypothetical protein
MKIVLVTLALHLPPAHIAECDFFLSGRMRRLEIVGKRYLVVPWLEPVGRKSVVDEEAAEDQAGTEARRL